MKTVLLISFDGYLAYSRRLLLEHLISTGIEAITAIGFQDGLTVCRNARFDLLVLCSSIPTAAQLALIREFRLYCSAPVISICNGMDSTLEELTEADGRVDSWKGPGHFLSVTSQILDSPILSRRVALAPQS